MTSTVLDPATVAPILATGLDPADLAELIAREEDWLANDPRYGIGPLIGERTERVILPPGYDGPIRLERQTSLDAGSGATLTVSDDGVELDPADYVLRGRGTLIERIDSRWSGPFVETTYTPTDRPRVERALLELVRLAVTASPYNFESEGGHSYTRSKEVEAQRVAVARTLHPQLGQAQTIRVDAAAP